jgi:hypothetical protein
MKIRSPDIPVRASGKDARFTRRDFTVLDILFSNYLLVSIIIVVIWLGSLIFYLYASKQHQVLENELNSLSQLLEEDQE